jgi:putative transposase
MKKTRFTESQIVAAIRKQENGMGTREVCRESGISEATFYNWKAKYGGMAISSFKKSS